MKSGAFANTDPGRYISSINDSVPARKSASEVDISNQKNIGNIRGNRVFFFSSAARK